MTGDSNGNKLNHQVLLPLHIVLFPRGIQRLRIFEPKYLALVSDSLRENKGFIIGFKESQNSIDLQLGIHVKIIDFDKGTDGVLTIDVQGEYLVYLQEVNRTEQGVWTGGAQKFSHWSMISSIGQTDKYAQVLRKFFQTFKEVDNLYPETYFDQTDWVCARLIEILPLPYEVKIECIKTGSFQFVTAILDTVLDEKQK